jgi:trigger factor
MANVEKTQIENTTSTLKVTISKSDYLPEFQTQLKSYRNRAQMKGFRPGTAPLTMIKKLHGKSILYEVMMDLMNKQLFDHIEKSGLQILAQPELVEDSSDKIALDVDHPMEEFSMTFKVGHYSFDLAGLEKTTTLTRYKLNDLGKRAEEELERIATKSVQPEETTEKIVEGDILYIAAKELDETGNLKADGYETTINVFTKGMNMSDAIKEQFYGKLSTDDMLNFSANELDMPRADKSDEENQKFFRRYVLNLEEGDTREVGNRFNGKITSVLRSGLPTYDVEFFEKNFPAGVTTKEAAIELLKEKLEGEYDEVFKFALRRQAKNLLVQKNQFELPESILRGWFMQNDARLTNEQVDENMSPLLNQVRLQLITQHLDDEIGFDVEQEEIEDLFIEQMREQYQFYIPDQYLKPMVKQMMAKKEEVQDAKLTIRHRKMMDYVISQMQVVNQDVEEEALKALIDQDIETENKLFGVKYQ